MGGFLEILFEFFLFYLGVFFVLLKRVYSGDISVYSLQWFFSSVRMRFHQKSCSGEVR